MPNGAHKYNAPLYATHTLQTPRIVPEHYDKLFAAQRIIATKKAGTPLAHLQCYFIY